MKQHYEVEHWVSSRLDWFSWDPNTQLTLSSAERELETLTVLYPAKQFRIVEVTRRPLLER